MTIGTDDGFKIGVGGMLTANALLAAAFTLSERGPTDFTSPRRIRRMMPRLVILAVMYERACQSHGERS